MSQILRIQTSLVPSSFTCCSPAGSAMKYKGISCSAHRPFLFFFVLLNLHLLPFPMLKVKQNLNRQQQSWELQKTWPYSIFSQGICWLLCRTLTRSAPNSSYTVFPSFVTQHQRCSADPHLNPVPATESHSGLREEKEWLKKSKETKRGAQGGEKGQAIAENKNPFLFSLHNFFLTLGFPLPLPR